ncbi:hypothetical protein RISK_001175 [Rhodopirellula islandica]|uniref:Uncharacterized protein n=1 Tax=Rhodopirellula islandica TaxID=595434 RepID=A0A0J1BJX7_RHOIS|nr:hypothetical protein RISK_001175 [Rhodopirellula islandica]
MRESGRHGLAVLQCERARTTGPFASENEDMRQLSRVLVDYVRVD